MPAPERTRLRVLAVARWYPSHDQPGRGSFVADLVAALADAGADVVVASFEATHVRGVVETRPSRGAAAAERMSAAVVAGTPASALNPGSAWGVAGVPVARLPVFLDGDRRRPSDVADAHDAVLRPFGLALARRWPFDVLQAHTGLVDGVVAARLADDLGLPLLVTEHSSTAAAELEDPEAAVLYRGLIRAEPGRSARRLVAVSRSLADDVGRALGLPDGTIDVLPNAVPIADFPLRDVAAAGWTGETAELLYVGSRKASKGIERLLRAFPLVRAARPEARLRLVGSPGAADDERLWASLAAELAPDGEIRIEGPIPRAEVAAAMRAAAVFVHPSPRETFGMVVAEALATGLPVATTPSGGGDEIVGMDGRYGAVAAGLEPDDLAAAILRVLNAPPSDGAAMRAHVETRYAAPAIAARTLEAYRDLGARPGPGAAGDPATEPAPAAGARAVAIVVAMARGQAVQRIRQLPLELANVLTIVTMPPAPSGLNAAALPGFGRWLELDPERFVEDALAAIGKPKPVRRGPLGGLDERHNRAIAERRAAVEADRDAIRAAGIRTFLANAIASAHGARPGGPAVIVALDADDVLLAEHARGDGAALAPGGLRWLADRWAASRAERAGRATG